MKTKLEEIGEQSMTEIAEAKKWNERAVTNEALDRKLDVVMEYVRDIPLMKQDISEMKQDISIMKQDIAQLQNDMGGMKAVLADHTNRLRRLEAFHKAST